MTVGPKDPAEPFVALELLNHLIALLHESRRLGWIIRDGVHQSMLTKLTTAKRRLEENDVAGARNNVSAVVSEVGGASCTDCELPRSPRVGWASCTVRKTYSHLMRP
jgi:hypothetical protein